MTILKMATSFLLMNCFVFSAQGAPKKLGKTQPFSTVEKFVVQGSPYKGDFAKKVEGFGYTAVDFEKTKSKESTSSRAIANVADMSAEAQDIRNKILSVKTADDLFQKLTEANANYDKLTQDDAKFMVALMAPMLSMRGFLYRNYNIAQKATAVRSPTVTSLKSLKSYINTYLPTEQWQAAFDFFTMPYADANGTLISQWDNENQVQVYIATAVQDALALAVLRIEGNPKEHIPGLNFTGKTLVWDNRILYGPASFQDDHDRAKFYGEVERKQALINLYSSMSRIAYFRAYSVDGILKIAADLGTLQGIDATFLGGEVDGVTDAKKSGVFNSASAKNYGLLYSDGGKWMNDSFTYLKAATTLSTQIWNDIKARSPSESYIFDTSTALSHTRTTDLILTDMMNSINGKFSLRSQITGEQVTVDIPSYFASPVPDLKKLLGSSFYEKADPKHPNKPEWKYPLVNGIEVETRNYDHGQAIAWKRDAYMNLFPDLKNVKDDEVNLKKQFRVLAQSWGGAYFVMPLAARLQ